MSKTDEILDILDAGLQHSSESGYPERYDDRSQCARCLGNVPVENSDMCTGCREFLLGDSDEDPKDEVDEFDGYAFGLGVSQVFMSIEYADIHHFLPIVTDSSRSGGVYWGPNPTVTS